MLAWERQENEGARAYEAFALYRDMGAARSIAKVGQMLGKSKALLERWSVAHCWVDRIRALEARDEMIKREAVEEFQQKKAEEHGEREVALRDRALRLRELAADQAEKMLSWPLTDQRVVEEDEDGNPVTYLFAPARWSKDTAIRFHGMVVGHASQPEEGDDEAALGFDELSDGELRQFIHLSEKLGVRRPRD